MTAHGWSRVAVLCIQGPGSRSHPLFAAPSLVQAASYRLPHLIFGQVVICQPVGLICSCLLSLTPPLTLTAVRELRVFRHRVPSIWATGTAWLRHGRFDLQAVGQREQDELTYPGSIGDVHGCAMQVCSSI